MLEIQPTEFVHGQEVHEPSIEEDAPYAIFEPIVEHITADGVVVRLAPEEVLQEAKAYTDDLTKNHRFTQGITIPLGGDTQHTLGEVVDTQADDLLEEAKSMSDVPDSVAGVLTTIAKLAEQSGFDRNKATFQGSFIYQGTESNNPNLNLHSDGLSGLAKADTKSVKTVRFVYALGAGTVLYPRLDKEGLPMDVDYTNPSGVKAVEDPTALQLVNSPRGATFSDEELLAGSAQQVRPGFILGFDPTRTFWHQAPNEDRPILVVDVKQTA